MLERRNPPFFAICGSLPSLSSTSWVYVTCSPPLSLRLLPTWKESISFLLLSSLLGWSFANNDWGLSHSTLPTESLSLSPKTTLPFGSFPLPVYVTVPLLPALKTSTRTKGVRINIFFISLIQIAETETVGRRWSNATEIYKPLNLTYETNRNIAVNDHAFEFTSYTHRKCIKRRSYYTTKPLFLARTGSQLELFLRRGKRERTEVWGVGNGKSGCTVWHTRGVSRLKGWKENT